VFHFSNCSVIIGFADQKKIVSQVLDVYGVGFMDQGKNMVQVANFSIGGFGGSRFMMDSGDSFWNTMFEKELPKYKDWLDTIFCITLLKHSMLTLPPAMSLSFCRIALLALCM
jgi:hypothetical protein